MLGRHEIVSINPLSRLQKVIKLQGDTIVTSKKKNINITENIDSYGRYICFKLQYSEQKLVFNVFLKSRHINKQKCQDLKMATIRYIHNCQSFALNMLSTFLKRLNTINNANVEYYE